MAAEAMTLDVAYKSLETICKVNLQVEFGREIEETECVLSLRQARDQPEHCNSIGLTGRLRQMFNERTACKVLPCLTCGTPVCKVHRSADFSKQNIIVCNDCAHLFSAEYLMTNIIHSDNNDSLESHKKKMNHMLEVYDRALLILTYSIQFIDEVSEALEENIKRHNKVGLGSSATGVVSGGLGVAAAVTIFTPVGPPLLLASILFGGGAAAVDAASEAVNYHCEPNKMADRILTLNSIIHSVLSLPAMVDMEICEAADLSLDKQNQILNLRRTAMNGLKPLTAGALSAISIVTEAREMKNTGENFYKMSPMYAPCSHLH